MFSFMVWISDYLFKRPKFPFNHLPYVCKRRFFEICDAETFLNFKKLDFEAKQLPLRRQVCEQLIIVNWKSIPKSKNPCIMVAEIDENHGNKIEVIKCLRIDLPKMEVVMTTLLENVVPLYSHLHIKAESVEFAVLKHLLRPNLQFLNLSSKIVFTENWKPELKHVLDTIFNVPKLKWVLCFPICGLYLDVFRMNLIMDRPKNPGETEAATDMLRIFAESRKKVNPRRKTKLLYGVDIPPPAH